MKNTLRMYSKFLLRLLSQQCHLERNEILMSDRKILVLLNRSSAIGDLIMEAGFLQLIKSKHQVDLLVKEPLATIFKKDSELHKVSNNINDFKDNYDLIIYDEYNSKCIRFKNKYFKNNYYLCLTKNFTSIEFNRMLFNFCRINQALGSPLSNQELDSTAHAYLPLQQHKLNVDKTVYVIGVGGEDARRTYKNWQLVVEQIIIKSPDNIVILAGADNGISDAQSITTYMLINHNIATTTITDLNIDWWQNNTQLYSAVSRLSLIDSAQLIANADYYIGADGGLMHIAEALCKPGVAIFAYWTPDIRLSYKTRLQSLYHANDIQQISYQEIITALNKAL